MNTFFTSDTHFGHRSIIEYCRKQFSSVEEMDEILIQNWNSVVKPNDRVYHLGDFAWTVKDAKRVRMRLNGNIRLVAGNHDDILGLADAKLFQRIYMWRIFAEAGITATHVPMRQDQLRHSFLNVHGHIHDKPSPESFQRCVCVEQTNYTPIAMEELQ
ncbi:metallophosphoesterase [Ensifer sp. ENS04]|uniref:metallophosphoesterase n=1 Tax=Ensifer sp. ENS04 TaxID=2769281 RepID=UPI00177D4475|nr:metallophosphoesterase [Ensifer sp. ENS04]MBD9544310.1 metallophosphoesterase [Ensifer sp. ENS04]